jgi:hypothetical protein
MPLRLTPNVRSKEAMVTTRSQLDTLDAASTCLGRLFSRRVELVRDNVSEMPVEERTALLAG